MEQNNQNEAAKQQNNNPGAGGGRHHRHRGRRGGKNHGGGKKENLVQNEQNTPEKAQSNNQAPAHPAEQQSNAQGQKNGHKHGRSRNRRHKSGSGAQGEARQASVGAQEDLSLADLRARIVLKAADGTIPAETHIDPETVSAPAPEKEEDVSFDPALVGDEILTPAPDIPTPIEKQADRIEVVGVRFRTSGKMYYFDPNGITAQKGQNVIVETTRGPEFGEVCLKNSFVNKKDTVLPLRPLVRIATEADIAHNAENREKEEKSLAVCREKIAQHKLDMKLIDAQYAFDNSKLLFYFSAEGRVDFRDLVKDLAAAFHTRIELRQIGIRDEARMLGGLGVCGRTLCCSTFLPDFAQVSIKMAKEQNLSLNSSKISGVCGRLMCCLHYEADVYSEEIRKTPSNDSIVKTPDGVGNVISSNPLAGTVRVVMKDGNDNTVRQYHRDQVVVIGKEKKGGQKGAEKGES